MCLARAGKTRLAIWIAIAAVNLAFRVAFARARSIPRGLFSLRLARAEARLRPNRSAMASACGVDLEVRWRDALTLLKKTRGKKLGSRKLCVLSPAAGVGDDEVEQWSAWFQSQRALLGGKVGRQLGVETVGYRTAPQLRKIQNKKLPKPGDLEAALLETGLPIHVASADYTAEDEQCMTVRLGDAISVHDVECLACPGYVYATNSLTREHGWIKAGVLR